MKPPIDGMKTIPACCDNGVTAGAWLSLLSYLSKEKQVTDAFKREAGFDLPDMLKQRGINAMIDEQTGYSKSVIVAWADWVTKNFWGEQ